LAIFESDFTAEKKDRERKREREKEREREREKEPAKIRSSRNIAHKDLRPK